MRINWLHMNRGCALNHAVGPIPACLIASKYDFLGGKLNSPGGRCEKRACEFERRVKFHDGIPDTDNEMDTVWQFPPTHVNCLYFVKLPFANSGSSTAINSAFVPEVRNFPSRFSMVSIFKN